MQKKRNMYGIYGLMQNYAEYGMTADRAKALVKGCREGRYRVQVQAAAQQAAPDIADWIISSIVDGKSLHDMEIRWELGESKVMPCGRNSFYSYRKLTLAILDRMLTEKEKVKDGKL